MGGGDEDDAPCNIRILSFLGAFSDEAPAGTPLVLLCCAAILQLSFLFLSLSFYSNVNIRGASRTEAEKAVTIVAMPMVHSLTDVVRLSIYWVLLGWWVRGGV